METKMDRQAVPAIANELKLTALSHIKHGGLSGIDGLHCTGVWSGPSVLGLLVGRHIMGYMHHASKTTALAGHRLGSG